MLLTNLPRGTTHVSATKVTVGAGGICHARFYCFKYVNQVLMMYYTDSDNEYPQWVPASNIFNKLPNIEELNK